MSIHTVVSAMRKKERRNMMRMEERNLVLLFDDSSRYTVFTPCVSILSF